MDDGLDVGWMGCIGMRFEGRYVQVGSVDSVNVDTRMVRARENPALLFYVREERKVIVEGNLRESQSHESADRPLYFDWDFDPP